MASIPGTEHGRRVRRTRTAGFLVIALTAVALGAVSVRTQAGQAVDTVIMEAVIQHLAWLQGPSRLAGNLFSTTGLTVFTVALAAVVVARRRYALLARSFLIVAGANIFTQVLKVVLERPNLGVGHALANSLPSGHVTMAASLAVVAIGVSPCRMRTPVSVLAGLVVFAQGMSVMILGWHRLSDVVTAILIAWAAGLAAVPAEICPPPETGRPLPQPRQWTGTVALLTAAGAVAIALGILLVIHELRPPVTGVELVQVAGKAGPGWLLALGATVITGALSAGLANAMDRFAQR